MIALWLAFACAGAGDSTAPCETATPLTYSGFGQGFMEKHCTGCHSSLLRPDQRNDAPLGIDLDSYREVLEHAERVEARVLGEGGPTMPPGGGPTEEELEMLAEWLRCEVYPDLTALEGAE